MIASSHYEREKAVNGQRPLYRMLGYFSIIGLLLVYVHRGDFIPGFKVRENVELNQQVGLNLP